MRVLVLGGTRYFGIPMVKELLARGHNVTIAIRGKFLAYLVDKDFTGAVNGSSYGTISLKEILQYVEQKA